MTRLSPLQRVAAWARAARRVTKRPPAVTVSSLRTERGNIWKSAAAAASYYEATKTDTPEMLFERDVALSIASGDILEVGAGTCRIASALASRGGRVVATDISGEMLAVGRRQSGGAFETVRASAFALPFAENRFDAVISYWLLLHFMDWADILKEIVRVARPGALMVFEYQSSAHLAKARELAPAGAFVERLQSPAGYQSAASPADVERIAARSGAHVLWTRTYSIFSDSLIAQAVLGPEYDTWAGSVASLIRQDACRRFWRRFEEQHLPSLPPYVGRKQVCVLYKGSDPPVWDAPLLPSPSAPQGIDDDTRQSWQLFVRAFAPVCAELAERKRIEQWM